jgi:hypothetical protein
MKPCALDFISVRYTYRKEATMSRADQSQTAVLGALSVMPMTGYALREEIRSVLGQFLERKLRPDLPGRSLNWNGST